MHLDINPPLPTGIQRISTPQELANINGWTLESTISRIGIPEELRKSIVVSPPQLSNEDLSWLAECAIAADFLGAHPDRPFWQLKSSKISSSDLLRIAKQFDQVRFRVRPDAIQDNIVPGLFPAWFLDLPGEIFSTQSLPAVSRYLIMRLPERDLRKIQGCLSTSDQIQIPEAFGFLGYSIKNNGDVVVKVISSDLHARITDTELYYRYDNWVQVILHALNYALVYQGTKGVKNGEVWPLKSITPKRIVLDLDDSTVHSLEDRLEDLLSTLVGSGPRLFDEMREWAELVSNIAISDLDYTRALYWVASSERGTKRGARTPRTALVRSIPPLSRRDLVNSDGIENRIFEPIRTPNLPRLEQDLNQVFPADMVALAQPKRAGYYTAHPVRPSNYSAPWMARVREEFELAPALSFGFCSDPLRYAKLDINALRAIRASPEARITSSILGEFFAPISRAAVTGGNQAWWEIPPDDGPSAVPVHIPYQNRHPSIRVFAPDENGQMHRFVVGFKGAGVCSLKGAEVLQRPAGLKLPIEYNMKESQVVIDDSSDVCPAPQPRTWGGEEVTGNLLELHQTLCLRGFISSQAPHLCRLIPAPLDARRLLSLPTWQDGQTNWISEAEYASTFLGRTRSSTENLSVLISLQSCDVRLRQAVDRALPETFDDGSAVAERINSTMESIYWWNKEKIDLRSVKIDARSIKSIEETLQYYHEIWNCNRKAADRIFAKSAGGLAELAGLVHGRGGHFGGGWRRTLSDVTLGISYGGPLALRNVDLTGGIHDLDLDLMYFPWFESQQPLWNSKANEEGELNRSIAFDIMYLAETVHWLDVLLHGRKTPRLKSEPVSFAQVNQFNELFLLNEEVPSTRAIRKLVADLSDDDADDTITLVKRVFPRASIGMRYISGFVRGAEARHTHMSREPRDLDLSPLDTSGL